MRYFRVSKQWHGCQCLGFLTCAQLLMHPIAPLHGSCTDTVREFAMKADAREKLPCHTWDSNPRQYCAWLFRWTLYQLSYSQPAHKGSCVSHAHRIQGTRGDTFLYFYNVIEVEGGGRNEKGWIPGSRRSMMAILILNPGFEGRSYDSPGLSRQRGSEFLGHSSWSDRNGKRYIETVRG